MNTVQVEIFPFASKTKPVRSVLPREIAHDLACVGMHRFRNCCVMSQTNEWRVENQNVGTSGSDASRGSGAIVRSHRIQNIVQVAVREPQVADESRSQNRRDSRLKLTGSRAGGEPVRRHGYGAAGGSDGVVKIQAGAQEGRMSIVDVAVKTHSKKIEIERTALNNIELRKDRMVIGNGKDAVLIVMFEVGEPKEAVFYEWASQAEPGLAAREKRIWIFRIAPQPWVCRQMVVPVVEERCAMQGIAASPGDDVDCAASGRTR